MHPTAWLSCHLFFSIIDNIFPQQNSINNKVFHILDIGSYDVNGNMRECEYLYIIFGDFIF